MNQINFNVIQRNDYKIKRPFIKVKKNNKYSFYI